MTLISVRLQDWLVQNHLDNDLDAYMQRTGKEEPETVSKEPAAKKS